MFLFYLENRPPSQKIILKYVKFGRKIGFRGPFMMEKLRHAIRN